MSDEKKEKDVHPIKEEEVVDPSKRTIGSEYEDYGRELGDITPSGFFN